MRGQQKGVDGLIYRDLTTLARAGVIHRAYIFTGDEDIRESVAAAQDLGVQVVIMNFKPTAQTGRSAELAREADEVVVLDPGFWTPHFAKRQTQTSGPPAEAALTATAQAFAHDWATGATSDEVRELLKREPQVPKELYVQLVLAAEKATGSSLKLYGKEKGDLRSEFWRAVKKEIGDSSSGLDDESQPEGAP